MSRDTRGNPGRIVLKNHQPKLRLADVLRRRRSTLGALVKELGVSTYPGLEIWCGRMGVVPPTLQEFQSVVPPDMKVSSPQEGVIVLEPPPVIDERSGMQIDPDGPIIPGIEVITSGSSRSALVRLPNAVDEPTKSAPKKARTKKDGHSTDE